MSVISRNPFDLLGEILVPPPTDDGEAPKAPVQAKKAATPASTEATKSAREVPGSKGPQQASRGRGGYYSRGAPRNVLKTGSAEKTDGVESTDPESGFEGERRAPGRNGPRGHGEGRGRGRATRAPRGGRGGAAGGAAGGERPAHGGERRHDGRRSAHALPDSEKRVASGWGADEGNAELAAEVEGAVDASKEAASPDADAAATPAAAAASTEAPVAEKKVEEEEDNTKSYEEYLAEKAKAASAFAQLEGRQVVGTSDFVGSALKKSDEPEDPFFSGLKKEKPTGVKKETSSKKEKIFIEHEGRFAPPSSGERGERTERRGGARGGRGGARGGDRPTRGAARGAARGGNNTQRQAPIAVNDDKAFPALGA
ncbi:hypothetical protein QFC21_002853 [Naganishia friedmannii]|uniref:Uncharacterized protein n=1 Tax=Naganishia friedmannii TaxID=89922 RepID=A0ACC2VTL5_9TREE|nr:hypothetical protein QFC21_002853 [Naganishia friedmannii]